MSVAWAAARRVFGLKPKKADKERGKEKARQKRAGMLD
jgi:hypothetical protein